MKIYKYPLEITDTQQISLPEGATILSTMAIGGRLYLWAAVDPTAYETDIYTIVIVGTGNEIQSQQGNGLQLLNTVVDGIYIWHVFVVIPADDAGAILTQ